MNNPIKTYTIQEISKLLSIPVGTIKRWEKDLDGLLIIPRTKQGARYYTNLELAKLIKVKNLRENNTSIEKIKDILFEQEQHKREQVQKSSKPKANVTPGAGATTEPKKSTIEEPPPISQPKPTTELAQREVAYETNVITKPITNDIQQKHALPNIEEFFNVMEAYKQNLLSEVKAEIRNGIRNEVIDEVRKRNFEGVHANG